MVVGVPAMSLFSAVAHFEVLAGAIPSPGRFERATGLDEKLGSKYVEVPQLTTGFCLPVQVPSVI